MKPREFLTAYVLALVLFLVLDAVWLSSMLERLYRPALGHLLAPQVAWPAAALFYLLYAAGIVGFAVVPALEANGPRIALLHGAALGLLAYATYDLSNQATLPGWPWAVTLADLAWGTFATGLAGWGSATLMLALRRRRADAASIA
jgi:uncharacterized membrane protein